MDDDVATINAAIRRALGIPGIDVAQVIAAVATMVDAFSDGAGDDGNGDADDAASHVKNWLANIMWIISQYLLRNAIGNRNVICRQNT